MKSYFLVFLLLILASLFYGQTEVQNQVCIPIGGDLVLDDVFRSIQFSPYQSKTLSELEVTIFFAVDTTGRAEIANIEGVLFSDLLDSLRSRSNYLPKFQPLIENFHKKESQYTYVLNSGLSEVPTLGLTKKQKLRKDDVESMVVEKNGFSALVGLTIPQHLGKIQRYFLTGTGMKLDVLHKSKRNFIIGSNLLVNTNKLKSEYRVFHASSKRSQLKTRMIGMLVGKWVGKTILQLELNYVVQDISYVTKGVSPGVVVNFPIKLGEGWLINGSDRGNSLKPKNYLMNNYLNFHFAFRLLFVDYEDLSGGLVEAGISYRYKISEVKSLKLKY